MDAPRATRRRILSVPCPRRSSLFACLLAVFFAPAGVGANPVPEWIAGIHVQEHASGCCGQLPFEACDQAIDLTAATGTLEFDFYFVCLAAGYGAACLWEDVVWRFTWPEHWSFVSAQACGHGRVLARTSTEALFEFPTLLDTPEDPYGFIHGLATLVLEVDARGSLASEYVSGLIEEAGSRDLADPAALAGYPCSGCPRRICAELPPRPVFLPEVVEIEVPEGMAVRTSVLVFNGGLGPAEPFVYRTSVPWAAVAEVETPHEGYERVILEIDAEALVPGLHEGLVLAACDVCTDCAPIRLSVVDATTPAEKATWGALKRRFAGPRPPASL